MYMVVNWEIVNSIYPGYTCVLLPNLLHNPFQLMYIDVFKWKSIHGHQGCDYGLMSPSVVMLPITYRQPLLSFHPPNKRALEIANGPTQLYEGWPIAAHASLGQPRNAEP